ncbi:MAG: flagellar basal body P-ring protein FlgI [Vampirovibrionales bacterium]
MTMPQHRLCNNVFSQPLWSKRGWGVCLLLASVWVTLMIPPVMLPTAEATTWVKLKDMSRLKEVRGNQVTGYGIVVGLNGTGDSSVATKTAQYNLLNNLGTRLGSINDLSGNNAAQVVVTATIPPFANTGDKLDVTLSSIGKVKSLEGGVLISTQLLAPNGEVIAVAQGPVSVGATSVEAAGSSASTGITTVGRIPQGGTIERDVNAQLGDSTGMTLILNKSDFDLANRVAVLISDNLAPAKAQDASSVRIQLPPAYLNNRVAFLAKLENLPVALSDHAPKVVINERTGTIVIGQGVKLLPTAVAHGGITVTVDAKNEVSQPNSFSEKGETTGVTNASVNIEKKGGALIHLKANHTLSDLVAALNSIGVTPSDLISILQALKVSGSLQADLEII